MGPATVSTFADLQAAARAGRVNALPHFRKRATEREFTTERAVQVLAADDTQAWRTAARTWLVIGPPETESGRHLHIRVKLAPRADHALLLTGWIGHPERTLRRLAGREEVPHAA